MNNVFKICDKCKNINIENLINEIKKIDEKAEFVIGCQNFCGICRTKAFIILNNMPIIAETENDLIIKIKEKITQ